jgi:hypothetical protein
MVERRHLERIGRTFLNGYHGTFSDSRPEKLAPFPNAIGTQF